MATEITPVDYEHLIRHVRDVAREAVRPGARMLVVSRGDDELLRFDNRVAWHFPRADNGAYAGYHPASSEHAIELLESLVDEGGQYLLVPASSFWWKDHYPGLFEYLDEKGTAVWDDDVCVVYELVGRRAGESATRPSPLVSPLRRLLEALVPRRSTVAVLTSGDSRLLSLDGITGVHFPQRTDGGYAAEIDSAGALEQLEELHEGGIEFLVVPRVAPSWIDDYPGFLEEIEARYSCIARRERVCTVYELNGRADVS